MRRDGWLDSYTGYVFCGFKTCSHLEKRDGFRFPEKFTFVVQEDSNESLHLRSLPITEEYISNRPRQKALATVISSL